MSNEKKDAANFGSIADALNSGDSEALERLMSAEVEEDEQEPEVEENEEVATPVEVEDDSNSSEAEPEEKPDAETPPEGEAVESTATPAVEPPKDEVEDLRRELHRYKSDAGRVPFMQRRLVEMERELRAVKARTAVDGVSPTVDPSKVELDPETAAQIEELRSIDPIMAKTLERVAKAAVATASRKVESVVETYTQADQEAEDSRFYSEQKTALVQAVPQADAIFATPEWKAWKETLSPGRRAMAESAYAEEVVQAIYAFAADMQQQQGRAEAPATQVVAAAPAQEASEVAQARQRKVNASAEVKNPSARGTVPFDEDKLFAEMYNQIGKESHILKT